jgi:hypothetical protein
MDRLVRWVASGELVAAALRVRIGTDVDELVVRASAPSPMAADFSVW